MSSSMPQIPVATHAFSQRYLFAFATQAEVQHHVRTQALQEELDRLPEIMDNWIKLQPKVADLIRFEPGLAEKIRVAEIPDSYDPKIQRFAADPLFQKTFSQHRIGFAMVEIDKLVCAQRTVNLDYVQRLANSYSKALTTDDLLDICVSPKRKMDPIQHLEILPNTHIFSSPNSDIRFLGAFVKQLTPEDLEYAVAGGLPAAAIIAFIGYGGAPVNVLQAGERLVLNNGFHRVYALRSLGVSEIPVVVQQIQNVELEFPKQVAGLPKEYLLGAHRPVLIGDFFKPDLAITIKVRERLKMVAVAIGLNQHEVPF